MPEHQRSNLAFQKNNETPSSEETLSGRVVDRHQEDQEKSSDDEEKGGHDGPPQPAGFFDKRLKKVRFQVFGLWARTSQSLMTLSLIQMKGHMLRPSSTDLVRFHPGRSVPVLGRPVPCGAEYLFSHCIRSRK